MVKDEQYVTGHRDAENTAKCGEESLLYTVRPQLPQSEAR